MTDLSPWIQNVSAHDVQIGHHFDPGPNSMLIQIMDPDSEFPTPKYTFKEVHQFKFLDIEEDGITNFGDGVFVDASELAIKDSDAVKIAELLVRAKANRMNVLVHCFAGVCRSGAVVDVGVHLGFRDPEQYRSPNRLVHKKLMNALHGKVSDQ